MSVIVKLTKWSELTLNDVCIKITDGAHLSPRSVDKGMPMASVKDLTAFGINLDSCRHISRDDYIKLVRQGCKPHIKDVLISKDGASALDTVCILKEDLNLVLLSSVAILRPDTKVILPIFLKYYLETETTRSYMKGAFISGAAIPRVVLKDFKLARINVPPLPTQRKIASILSAYDDLIENNQRRIKILEEMAQNLYREWFVKFRFPGHEKAKFVDSPLGRIPEGWEVKRLGDVAANFDRLRKPLSKMVRAKRQGKYPYYGAAKIFDYIDDYIFDGVYLLMAEDGSVITPDRKPVLQYVTGKFWANNHTHILQGIGAISTEFLNIFLSNLDVTGYITGAAQPKITQANLNRIPIIVSDNFTLFQFNKIMEILFRQKILLDEKKHVLRRTRDLLLPKLISGEVDVSGLDIAVPEEVEA